MLWCVISMFILALSVIFLVILFAYIFHVVSMKNRVHKREKIPVSEQCSTCLGLFDSLDETVIYKAFSKVSEIFSVPEENIKLNDVFGQDLGRGFFLSMFDSMQCEDFYEYVDSQERVLGVQYDLPIKTVLDFVQFESFIQKNSKVS